MSQNTQSAALQNNPLVNPPKTKYNMPAWDQIKPEHFLPAMEWAMEKARANLDVIRALSPEEASFETVVEPLESFNTDMSRISHVLSYYTNNATTDEYDDLQTTIGKLTRPLYTEAMADKNIYTKLEAVYNNQKGLSAVEKRLTEVHYKGFKSGPVSLSGEQREAYLALSAELSEKDQAYNKNIMTHMNKDHEDGLKVVIKASEVAVRLAGVNPSSLASFKESNGDVVIGALPESIDVLEQCTNRETRRLIYNNWVGRGNIGAQNNSELTSEIHQIKQKMAQLFGYDNIVEQTIRPDTRAAKSSENVWNILYRMRDVGFRASWDIYNEIAAAAKQDGLGTINDMDITDLANMSEEALRDVHLQAWDTPYYANLVEQAKGGIDPAEEKKYFKVSDCMDGLQRSMKRRYGIVLEETNDFKMPCDDMQVFYSKKKNGDVDGIFLVDLYQREGKRPGAWMDQLRPAGEVDGEWQVPITLVNCNYADEYISFDNNETLYHEWGHAGHGHASQGTKYQTLNSIDIAWDAVEFPSQLNEGFAAHRRHFNSYAKHCDTGKNMPKALYDKLIEEKPDNQLLRQNQFGSLDMYFYSETDKIDDIAAFNQTAFEATQIIPSNENNAMVNAFSHITSGGYSAGYYSYLYANFMVAGQEELFEKHGQKAITAFKKEFSSVGCLKDASAAFDDIYKRLGEPVTPLSPDGFLKSSGFSKYVEQADADGTSGEGVAFDKSFTRLKISMG